MKSPVRVVFARGFPEGERAWVARLIRRCARLWGTEAFEYTVRAQDMGTTLAKVTVMGMANMVDITLSPKRLADRTGARDDLVHELLHVIDEEVRQALVDLAAHISDPARRVRAYRRAERRYEALHDRHAKMWAKMLTARRVQR